MIRIYDREAISDPDLLLVLEVYRMLRKMREHVVNYEIGLHPEIARSLYEMIDSDLEYIREMRDEICLAPSGGIDQQHEGLHDVLLPEDLIAGDCGLET